MDWERMMEILENRFPNLWKFQMDKEGFGANSSTIKEVTKTCVGLPSICDSVFIPNLALTSSLEYDAVDNGICDRIS
eukprot:7561320-Ditylum_brightwellii.AAC.1